MELGCKPALNESLARGEDNSEIAFGKTKTDAEFPIELRILQSTKDIYPKQGFCDKICRSHRKTAMVSKRRTGLASVHWERGRKVPKKASMEDIYRRNIHTWAARMIGEKIYQHAMTTMREYGNDNRGGKLNSRKWAEEQCETDLGDRGEDWKSIAISKWWICVKDGVMNHVLLGPYEIYEIRMEANHEQKKN